MLCTALALCVLPPALPPVTSGVHLVTPTAPGVVARADDHGNVALAVQAASGPVVGTGVGGALALSTASWEAIGPFGGDVADVAASPTAAGVVLAGIAPSSGTGGTMFRSTDGGANWSEVAALTGRSVYDLEFAPDGTAYAGTIDSVFKSTDGGASWTQHLLGIGVNDQVLEITIDPNDPLRLWVGVADALGSQTTTLLLSTDGGNTWASKTPAGGPYGFSAIAVQPGNSNKVYAGWEGAFGGGGVFVSSDGGTTWTDRSAGLPGNPIKDVVHDGTRLLLTGGQLFGSQNVGIWTTANDGLTWTELSNAGWPLRVFNDLELQPGNPSHILAASAGNGIYESFDGGATWAFGVGGTGGLSSNEVSYAPTGGGVIYVGSSSNAVWKSTNGGTSYAPSSFGIGQLNVYSIATNPTNPLEVAIAYQGLNDGGVQTSLDGGLTWAGAAVPGTRWNTVGFDETGTLYAISDGPTTIAPEALYRRTGSTWTSIGPDQGSVFESELVALTFTPGAPNTILAGGSDFGVAGAEATVWKTTDGGVNWTKAYESVETNEDVLDIVYAPGAPGVLVACFDDFEGVQDGGALRSTDGGTTWAASNTGLASECQGWSLDVPAGGSKIYLADADTGTGNGGLYESADGGATWSQTNASGTTRYVSAQPAATSTLYTTHFTAPKVRASEDDGATLSDYTAGLSASATVQGMHLNNGGTYLYIATNQGSWRTAVDVGGTGTEYCFGVNCPCGNDDATAGCQNGTGVGGKLAAAGAASVSGGALVLTGSALPPNQPGLYFQGLNAVNGGAGTLFGDGLRCAGGSVVRLQVRAASAAGTSSTTVNVAAVGGVSSGDVRRYQLWYRDPAGSPCGAFFNLTNGVELVWQP
ncbi:MAG: hypothetical protein H6828_10230 [Planctomycetes bacterium]|nr:hypothetical protein [Planctomycetota bacterium]